MGTTAAKLKYTLDSKNAIREVLQEKYDDVTSDIGTYADLIRPLMDTSDATATEEDILEGETAYVNGEKITGTATAGIPIVTTEGDGAAYTATVSDKVTELTVGMKLTIIPHVTSESTAPSLNVNNLGAKVIRQRLSTNTSLTSVGPSAGWLVANKPVTVMYNGTYWVAELTRTDANNLYGTVPITSGGTGGATLEAAQENLGITEIQTNLEEFQESFESGLSTIANAITEKGVETAADASPETMAANIRHISRMSGVLQGKTTYNTGASITTTHVFKELDDCTSLYLAMSKPSNGSSSASTTVTGSEDGGETYVTVGSIGRDESATFDITAYNAIGIAIKASHSGNNGHSATATYNVTYNIE